MATRKKTQTITDVREALQGIGDSLNSTYESTKDLKAAQGAVSAYSAAISAAKTQLIYKKLTGNPGEITFLTK